MNDSSCLIFIKVSTCKNSLSETWSPAWLQKHYLFWALENVPVTNIIDPWQWLKITPMTFTRCFFSWTLALLLCCILFPSMTLHYIWTNLIGHPDTNAKCITLFMTDSCCINLFMIDSCCHQWQHTINNANNLPLCHWGKHICKTKMSSFIFSPYHWYSFLSDRKFVFCLTLFYFSSPPFTSMTNNEALTIFLPLWIY